MPQNKKLKAQSGNVFIIILIGIILFAALLYTFTNSTRSGTGNLSAQERKIAVQEILNYARLLEQAVSRIRLNGCSENEISFLNTLSPGKYNNPNAPSDNSCHIFEPEGGRLAWQDFTHGQTFIEGNNCVHNIGVNSSCDSNDKELLYYLIDVGLPLCQEINNTVNNIDASIQPSQSNFNVTIANNGFNGDFDFALHILEGPTHDGFYTACGQDNAGSTDHQYIIYHTLIAR